MRTSSLLTTAVTVLVALAPAARAVRAQGWIVPRGSAPASVVRTSSDVRAELRDRVIHYEVDEMFTNRGGLVGEADYLFPLPEGAAFQELKLSINGQLVAGETMNAGEARRIYEEIVRRQKDPALVEWMGRGLLRTRIFPIQPGEQKRIVVRFDAVAQREGDALRVDYFRGASQSQSAQSAQSVRSDVAGGREPEGRVHFALGYPLGDGLGTAWSPTHDVSVEERGGEREVTVKGDAREMTLLIPLRRRSEAGITVLANAPAREDGYALITLTPPASAARPTPRDVTFVIDVSGSMSGRKIEQARAAGKQLLATLSPRDRFRLIDFSSDVRVFRDEFVNATDANLRAATEYLDGLQANGGTNIAAALDEALAPAPEAGRLPLVLFLTDGEPSVGERAPEAIAERAARARGDRRIFTFGLGADVNVALIEQLALEGRGTAQFVRPDEDGERAVSVVASRLTNPVATNVRVRAEGARLSKVLPAGPVDLFAGQDLVLLARYHVDDAADNDAKVRLRFDGESSDGPVSWSADVDLPTRERDNGFVPRLWATQRVGWLSAEKRKHGGSPEIDAEIRELGERFGIPTEFTSYLVQEPGQVAQSANGANGVIQFERRRAGAGGVAGGVALPVVPPAAAPARERAFAEAKAAQAQRAATSVAALDAMAARADDATTRRVDGRTFTLRDGVWTDVRVTAAMKVVRVKAYSPAYFKVVELLPELRPALALGERVIVAGRTVAIEVSPLGAEALATQDEALIKGGW